MTPREAPPPVPVSALLVAQAFPRASWDHTDSSSFGQTQEQEKPPTPATMPAAASAPPPLPPSPSTMPAAASAPPPLPTAKPPGASSLSPSSATGFSSLPEPPQPPPPVLPVEEELEPLSSTLLSQPPETSSSSSSSSATGLNIFPEPPQPPPPVEYSPLSFDHQNDPLHGPCRTASGRLEQMYNAEQNSMSLWSVRDNINRAESDCLDLD
eukprot:CAMPEP_0171718806 /NCGR_PEP_ID=MMETSP0991-20121206/20819_1 /TAXON_ID=483369 /ORGANISM="non described non described, Strain CCMP2098" /LENGTH=210 /DNA_ID=CAMNT_0012310227 /DNA_START=93 /DNA_END=725 /DNA_ORIENTATION=+